MAKIIATLKFFWFQNLIIKGEDKVCITTQINKPPSCYIYAFINSLSRPSK